MFKLSLGKNKTRMPHTKKYGVGAISGQIYGSSGDIRGHGPGTHLPHIRFFIYCSLKVKCF